MHSPSSPRPARRIALALAAVALLTGGGYYTATWAFGKAFDARFHPDIATWSGPAPRDRAEAVREDLEYLGTLLAVDRSFSPEAARRFETERRALIARAAELTPSQVEMEVSRLVALGGNGHTTVGRRLRRLGRVPIRLAWFAEGLFVVRADPAHADLLGARVLAVNGMAPEAMLKSLVPYVSGTPENAKALSPLYLASPYALAGVWPQMSAESAEYRFATGGGERTETLEAIAPDPSLPYISPARDMAPPPAPGESPPWPSVLAGNLATPLVLRDPDSSLHVSRLDGGKGLYVHMTQVMGDARGTLSGQLAEILGAVAPKSLRYAVLDLRFNGGGDYTQTLDFTKELPKRIADDGKLFILTDNATFSAGIVTFARARYFAGQRAVVIGEHVGDRERFWAEAAMPIELPNSKIPVYYATGYHDWENGCGMKDVATCFWLNFAYDVPSGPFKPDREVAWRFADFRQGVDTVMEAVMRARPG